MGFYEPVDSLTLYNPKNILLLIRILFINYKSLRKLLCILSCFLNCGNSCVFLSPVAAPDQDLVQGKEVQLQVMSCLLPL